MEKIWVDKYRPQTFKEVQGQDSFVNRIKHFVEKKNLPHLLFAGSPGTGKTTCALVIANELYGKQGAKGNFLELNASDDRGIDVIRNKIKEFAKLKSLVNIPYKIIYLDEADSLTREAQQALRRTMEVYSKSCRFILACNEISKILDPIQSRCVIFRFKPLEEKNLQTIIEKIEKSEKLTIDIQAKELLIQSSKGDVRKLQNLLQSVSSVSKIINLKTLNEILDFVEPKEIQNLINYSKKGNFLKARDCFIKLKIKRGFTGTEILKEIYKEIINDNSIEEKIKIKIIDRIGTIEFRIVEGSDEEIQLESLIAFLSYALK